ncbi:MAG: glycosyltransferase [Microthrixaceae bacterium]|nr:glycosyltransferase [Microthrixaceae bacterium]
MTTPPPSPSEPTAADAPPLLSVITPTYNEAENIVGLLEALAPALAEVSHEIIVVDDDSPDGTWELAERYAETHPGIRVLRRFHDKGLSPAVLAGMEMAEGQTLAVIDADGQHDEAILATMARRVAYGDADVCVGSRSSDGGSYGDWSRGRRLVSWVATLIARLFLRVPLTDPMSGYFVIDREAFEEAAPDVNPQGFKILLEFLGRRPDLSVIEVGYTFRNRTAGETKLNSSVIRSYLLAVFDLRFGHLVKPQLLLYTLVGLAGVGVNFAVIIIGEAAGFGSITTGSEAIDPLAVPVVAGLAAQLVMTFAANNWFTFWENRYQGSRLAVGFGLFSVISAYGLMIQFAVAKWFDTLNLGEGWMSDGAAAALHQLIAILVAFQASYFLNVNLTWRRRERDELT